MLALDTGAITNGTAGQWLSGTLLGAVAEYQRRTSMERSRAAQARAIARGVVPWPNIPPGYRRRADGILEPDPATSAAVAEAFAMRARGATLVEVRAYLVSQGVKRSVHGVQHLLTSRVVLGEIHFGDLVNLHAHEPIVDRDLFDRVQRIPVPRGRRPKSDRLLARLGVLQCGTCDSRMVVGTQRQNGRSYPFGANDRRYFIHSVGQRTCTEYHLGPGDYASDTVRWEVVPKRWNGTIDFGNVTGSVCGKAKYEYSYPNAAELDTRSSKIMSWKVGVSLYGVSIASNNQHSSDTTHHWKFDNSGRNNHILCGTDDEPMFATRTYAGA